jgi:hypothetical protein
VPSINNNRRLADNNARQRITQNHRQREYGRDTTNLHNIIDDRRHNRARALSPQWHSLVRALALSGKGVFHTLAPELRQVTCLDKFKPRPIDKYDGSNNPKEFIQVYHMFIEDAGGDD